MTSFPSEDSDNNELSDESSDEDENKGPQYKNKKKFKVVQGSKGERTDGSSLKTPSSRSLSELTPQRSSPQYLYKIIESECIIDEGQSYYIKHSIINYYIK
jgi:hypothetical protein